MTATAQTFPYRATPPELGVTALVGHGGVTTVVGQLERIELGWAGQMRCVLRLSVGPIVISANRKVFPLDAVAGAWVRVRLMPWRTDGDQTLRVISAVVGEPDVKVAWVPTSLYHRHVHIKRLRAVLAGLEPALQLIFMLALKDPQLQRAFFWRVGAADHHGYPGGLFDQSVQASELAQAKPYQDEHERGLATAAALCFDLGKLSDAALAPDAPRFIEGPTPHPLTQRRLERALVAVEALHPRSARELRDLLMPTPRQRGLAQRVREAVRDSWRGPER